MKKTLVSALTTALVVGAASTTFAAANPFSDVPTDHWAYDAVSQLANDGVINGYGDDTFQGDKAITRYEMAQMVAKAMAKEADLNAQQKAMVDKLAAEFSEELNNLGVRVKNLEKYADKVQWKGMVRYTYNNLDVDGETESRGQQLKFRLEPKAEIAEHWTANARIDANLDFENDKSADLNVSRAWAQGNYNNFQVKLGRIMLDPDGEHETVFDGDMTGAEFTFGKDFKTILRAGNIKNDSIVAGLPDAARMYGVQFLYDNGKKLYGGASYTQVNSDNAFAYDDDKANIWALNAGYHFKNAEVYAAYAKNNAADDNNTSWQIGAEYGKFNPANKGSWSVYAAYRSLGYNSTLFYTEEDATRGAKGFALGASWAPFKNIALKAKYFKGTMINSDEDVQRLFGRVEFLF